MLSLLPRSYKKGLETTMRLGGAGFEITYLLIDVTDTIAG